MNSFKAATQKLSESHNESCSQNQVGYDNVIKE